MSDSQTPPVAAESTLARIQRTPTYVIAREFDELRAEVERLTGALEVLGKGITAVNTLICESSGVDGLHLNGDLAKWDDLRTGGRFETWLAPFDDALAALPPTPGDVT